MSFNIFMRSFSFDVNVSLKIRKTHKTQKKKFHNDHNNKEYRSVRFPQRQKINLHNTTV
jgi:sulfur relay (sulfurtransferase) DsrC/TusE family protein